MSTIPLPCLYRQVGQGSITKSFFINQFNFTIMRKLLLMAVAAMASFSVNAQVALTKIDTQEAVKMNVTRAQLFKSNPGMRLSSPILKASGAYGTYISAEYNEQDDIYDCKEVLIESVTNVEGANVKVTFSVGSEFKGHVYGTLENDNKITIPAQDVNDGELVTVFGLNNKVAFCAYKDADQEGYINFLKDNPFVFQKDEAGTWTVVTSEQLPIKGWAMVIIDYPKQGENSILDSSREPEMHKANGVMTGTRMTKQETKEINLPVYVQDDDAEISVFNHYAGTRMKIDIVDKEAGTFQITTPQNIMLSSKQAQDDGFGRYMRIVGCNKDGQFTEDEPVKGKWANNVLTFNPAVWNGKGDPNNDLSGVYAIGTKIVNGSWYFGGEFDDVVISYGSDDPTGIENVATEAVKKDNRIFNLAGQQVGKDYKGIVIKNGKKMIQK